MKVSENMLHFADLSIWIVVERIETTNVCPFIPCITSLHSCKVLDKWKFFTHSLLGRILYSERNRSFKKDIGMTTSLGI